jgi:glycerol dehydrogenase-like iron-containing ADH family enzyme
VLREGRHSILHGAKVGVGVLISAPVRAMANMSREEAAGETGRGAAAGAKARG